MTEPFITQIDEQRFGSKDPLVIGQGRMIAASNKVNINMSDDDLRAITEEVITLKNQYKAWADFKNQLDLRKKRLLGFQSVVLAMDVTEAAVAMKTSPQLVAAVMQGYAAQESARITELQKLYDTGILPDRPVLTDPSAQVIHGSDIGA